MLIAYIQDQSDVVSLEEQLKVIETYDYQMIYINKVYKSEKLQSIIEQMKPRDTFLVYQLACLGMTSRSLSNFFKAIQSRHLSFISVKDNIKLGGTQNNQQFLDCLNLLINVDKQVRSRRTIEGLEESRKNGVIVGRPSIAQEKIDQMIRLYREKHYSYRKIAVICEVSVGVVYKYVKRETEKQLKSEEKQ